MTFRMAILAMAAMAGATAGIADPAHAQRDPEYAAARANGLVGEKFNGYLGIVGEETPRLQRLVNDINIRRKAVYARKAQEQGATIEQYAVTAGCEAIERTVPGEKYEAPNGAWKTRTDAPPERLSICP